MSRAVLNSAASLSVRAKVGAVELRPQLAVALIVAPQVAKAVVVWVPEGRVGLPHGHIVEHGVVAALDAGVIDGVHVLRWAGRQAGKLKRGPL